MSQGFYSLPGLAVPQGRVPEKKEEKEEGEGLMILDLLTCPSKTDLKGSVEDFLANSPRNGEATW